MTFEEIKYAYKCYCYGFPLSDVKLTPKDRADLQNFIKYSQSKTIREIADLTGWRLCFTIGLHLQGKSWQSSSKSIRESYKKLAKLQKHDPIFFKKVITKVEQEEFLKLVEKHIKTGWSGAYILEKTRMRTRGLTKLNKFIVLYKREKHPTVGQITTNLAVSQDFARQIIEVIEKYGKDKKEEIKIKV